MWNEIRQQEAIYSIFVDHQLQTNYQVGEPRPLLGSTLITYEQAAIDSSKLLILFVNVRLRSVDYSNPEKAGREMEGNGEKWKHLLELGGENPSERELQILFSLLGAADSDEKLSTEMELRRGLINGCH